MIAMQTEPRQAREEVYTHQLETLRQEMHIAMSAISGNALGALENSLWRQEVLCASLSRLLQSLQEAKIGPSALHRMQATTASLHALNQTYADLVQQSRASTNLLSALCQTYKDPSPRLLSHNTARSCSLEA